MPPQTSYSLDNPATQPGQLLDNDSDVKIVPFIANEDIPFGIGLEFEATGTKVQRPRGTGAPVAQFAGVSVYKDTLEPGGYKAGDVVDVLRKGRVAVTTVGTAIAQTDALTAANVSHSSTTDADRGKFTKGATSGTAGSEVGDVGAKWARKAPSGISNLAYVELNLP